MKKRQERLGRIKAIEREYLVAHAAMMHFESEYRIRPELLHDARLKSADLIRALERLEERYLTSLFAEFEAGLRDVWEKHFGQSTVPRTRDLIDGIAARRTIAEEDRDGAHGVREYRNKLVHERSEDVETMALRDASSQLCKFFKWLPLDW